jgi:hypothetical protein
MCRNAVSIGWVLTPLYHLEENVEETHDSLLFSTCSLSFTRVCRHQFDTPLNRGNKPLCHLSVVSPIDRNSPLVYTSDSPLVTQP